MRLKHILSVLGFFILFTSCNGQNNKLNQNGSPAANNKTTVYKEGVDYVIFERVRLLDKTAFTKPEEAYSILLPKGWRSESDIIWNQPGGSCPGTFKSITATSADGKYKFEMLPDIVYSYSQKEQEMQEYQSNPESASLCNYGEPMDAEQYLKNVFAANELGNPEVLKVEPNRFVVEEMAQSNDKARMELMQYGSAQIQFYQSAINAKVRWKNGTEGMVVLGVSTIANTVPNPYDGSSNVLYTMQVMKRTTFKYPVAESRHADKLFSMIMGSFRTNPGWSEAVSTFWRNIRQQKHTAHIGTIRMLDAQTRAIGNAAIAKGNERLNNMDNDMRSWEQQQSSQDRMHTNFIKTIREVENYRDETGKIEMASAYNHAWSRSDGSSFIMSNDPNFDPSSVLQDPRWKEMKKVH